MRGGFRPGRSSELGGIEEFPLFRDPARAAASSCSRRSATTASSAAICSACQHQAQGPECLPHFIGSVVIAPSPTLQAKGVNRWLLIDGRRRLTTLMLALAAIRDHISSSGEGDVDRIHRQYLLNEFRKGDDQLRLLPTQTDRNASRALILRILGAAVTGTVGDAYRFFRTALASIDDSDDGQEIMRDRASDPGWFVDRSR